MIDSAKIDLGKEIAFLEKLTVQERGTDIKFLVNYVKSKEGLAGLKKVEAALSKVGYQMPDVEKIGDLEWIPSSCPTIFMVASVKVFNWQESDLIELGKSALAFHPLLRRFFIKYFLSLEKTFKKAVQIWPKQYSEGRVEIVKYEKQDQSIVVRLINFKKHPFICLFLQGVFIKIIKTETGSRKVIGRETKCAFKGDPYHEFVFEWQ